MNTNPRHSDDGLADPLKSVIESIANNKPSESQMESFLSALKESSPVSPRSLKYTNKIRSRVLFGLVSTAALVVILFGLQLLPRANALEQIAKALTNVQCIKATTVVDNKMTESWLVRPSGEMAYRDDQGIEFVDSTNDVLTSYDFRTKELVRGPLPKPRNSAILVELVESFAESGRGNVPKTIRGMSIKSLKVEKTGARRVLHLDLSSDDEAMSGSAKIVLQENGDLPVHGVVNLSKGAMTQQIETKWEYPPLGPTDIFALGVPVGTSLIDRIPSPEIKRLLADVYKGRLEFDDYRAVVFATKTEILQDIDSYEISLVSKKGNRLVLLRNAEQLKDFSGRNVADVANELLENANSIKWQPATLLQGQDVYRFSQGIIDNSVVSARHSYQTSRHPNSPEFFTMPSSHRVPNLVGRPMTGVGAPSIGAIIVSNEEGGLEGCVQLRTVSTPRRVSGDPEHEGSSLGHSTTSDFWIDTSKEALVVKYRTQKTDGSTSTYTLSELTQSPIGHWYPKIAVHTESSTSQTTIYRYFTEFSNPLPDAMFEVKHYVDDRP
jgi:hypothetical protein